MSCSGVPVPAFNCKHRGTRIELLRPRLRNDSGVPTVGVHTLESHWPVAAARKPPPSPYPQVPFLGLAGMAPRPRMARLMLRSPSRLNAQVLRFGERDAWWKTGVDHAHRLFQISCFETRKALSFYVVETI
jgi:hypothetical protein